MILVADDDESIRRMTKVALERLGYRVLLAQDGAEAVEAFAAIGMRLRWFCWIGPCR